MPELRTAQDFREAPTRTIAAAGAQFAYRELGPRAGVPAGSSEASGREPGQLASAHCGRACPGPPCDHRGQPQRRGLPAPLTPLRTITHRTP